MLRVKVDKFVKIRDLYAERRPFEICQNKRYNLQVMLRVKVYKFVKYKKDLYGWGLIACCDVLYMNAYLCVFYSSGSTGSEKGHWPCIRYENSTESGNVRKGSGTTATLNSPVFL